MDGLFQLIQATDVVEGQGFLFRHQQAHHFALVGVVIGDHAQARSALGTWKVHHRHVQAAPQRHIFQGRVGIHCRPVFHLGLFKALQRCQGASLEQARGRVFTLDQRQCLVRLAGGQQ